MKKEDIKQFQKVLYQGQEATIELIPHPTHPGEQVYIKYGNGYKKWVSVGELQRIK